MQNAALALGIAFLTFANPSQGRQPVTVPPAANRGAEIAQHLQRAAEAARAWRSELAGGAAADPAQAETVKAGLRELMEALEPTFERLHAEAERERLAKQSAAPAPALDERAEHDFTTRAWPLSRLWIDDARALGEGSAARRERALTEICAALGNADAVGNLAALQALQQLGDVQYDKAAFRPLILPFAREARGAVLVAALYALANTDREAADLELVHAGWERDPEGLRGSVLHLLFLFGNGDLKGRSEAIALEVLADPSERRRRGINGMWGARVGPQLEARVLELSRSSDRELRHDAIYFGLSTFQDKSAAVVECLIASLSDPDHNNSGRALWGLGHGVPPAQRARVVEALIELHGVRSDRGTREDCERILENYGGEAALARLAR